MTDWTPLGGVTVIDCSQQLPGPFSTLLLATLGARVIKVEPPAGDPAREIDPPMFERVNAGKQCVRLDLKADADRARLHELVAAGDVFVEGFRPGVTARLAADWETLSAINPRLVYCSISGFGATGPLASRPGHDVNFLALAAGLPAGLTSGEALIRVPWVDLAAGTNAALTIVAALHERDRSGRGRHLELAMLDAATAWAAAKQPRPGAEGAYGVFASADGRRVAAAVLEGAMWRRLCQAFGWSDWLADETMDDHDGRRARAAQVSERLAAELAARTADEVGALALEHDLALTPVNEPDEAARDPQIATRGLFADGRRWRALGPAGRALELADASTPAVDARQIDV